MDFIFGKSWDLSSIDNEILLYLFLSGSPSKYKARLTAG